LQYNIPTGSIANLLPCRIWQSCVEH